MLFCNTDFSTICSSTDTSVIFSNDTAPPLVAPPLGVKGEKLY